MNIYLFDSNLFAFDGILHVSEDVVSGLVTRGNRFYYKTQVFGQIPDDFNAISSWE
jgi:hypothetical protein